MNRYVCIHGHFYQPPRENPWLEEIELQDSAYPYHDWNERITTDCYSQNAASRILDKDKKIIDIVNNYSKMSFNFGPTLLSWMEKHQPSVYQAILDADKKSMEHFDGHGAAIAQIYNHMIMPLASPHDKQTQIIWGIADFEYRFKRKPKGMWLAETAVDIPTLEALAQQNIAFTILAPRQAQKVRQIDSQKWLNVENERIDSTMPYLCNLPSGRSIVIFFYNGPVSKAVAYGDLLKNGEVFSKKLIEIFSNDDSKPQLAHIATDGETYGHHHRYGEMALAYCIHNIEEKKLAQNTVYSQYLEKFPPTHEVQIIENTSWSCDHGIERWRDNCGCNYGRFPKGLQQWRKPLRNALDMLRDELADIFMNKITNFAQDPWLVRDRYIKLILDRSEENVEKFLDENITVEIDEDDKLNILRLLESQRQAMLMYTSCGWFFDDIAGIETLQIMQYASRAIQLVKEVVFIDLEPDFLRILADAPVNEKGYKNGKDVYQKMVKPVSIDLNRVGAHYAISSLFNEYHNDIDIYCYTAKVQFYELIEAGLQKLAIGRVDLKSNILLQQYPLDFAVLHFGDQNLIAAVSFRISDDDFREMHSKIKKSFQQGNTAEVMRLMNLAFSSQSYSLWHLFKDEQRKILYQLLESTWLEIEASFRNIYEHNYNIMQAMVGMDMPLPQALATPAEFIINKDLCKTIQAKQIRLSKLENLVKEAQRLSLKLDKATLTFEAGRKINNMINELSENPNDPQLIELISSTIKILSRLFAKIDLAAGQNVLFSISKQLYSDMTQKAASDDQQAKRWVNGFDELANALGVKV